tara:strand:+ start:7317 stop:7517 length:201 start_codon:yes stop_codon:yes gene_type:complete
MTEGNKMIEITLEEYNTLKQENALLRRQIVEETKARYTTYRRMQYYIENQSIVLRKISRWFQGFYK